MLWMRFPAKCHPDALGFVPVKTRAPWSPVHSGRSLGPISSSVLLAAVLSAGLGLSACSQSTDQEGDDAPVGMGNATPAASPALSGTPAGDALSVPSAITRIDDVVGLGEIIAVRGEKTLAMGTLADFQGDSAKVVELPSAECGDITITDDTVVIPCGTQVLLINDGEITRSIDTEMQVRAAALTSTGEVVVANHEDNKVWVHHPEADAKVDEIIADRPSTQILALPQPEGPDAVVRTWNETTTIQDIQWTKGKPGGTLRVGLGIGRMSPGEDGTLVVSDTTGDQIAIYTADRIIRLHQTAPIDDSPWAVAWDKHNHLAWAASTGTNSLVGYDISQGVPEERQRLSIPENTIFLSVLDDGSLITATKDAKELRLIPNPGAGSSAK